MTHAKHKWSLLELIVQLSVAEHRNCKLRAAQTEVLL